MNTRIHALSGGQTLLQRCLLVLLAAVMTTALAGTTLSAQERCEEGHCTAIKIYNETRYDFTMLFKVCCDGVVRETGCDYRVPAGSEVKFDFRYCTILKFAFCNRIPQDVCMAWSEDRCILKIYYCN